MDAQTKRLGGAIVASLLVNGILWRAFGGAVLLQKAAPPQVIEFSRVVLTRSGQSKPKVITRRQIARRVEQIRKLNTPKRLVRPLNTVDRPRRYVPPTQTRVPVPQNHVEAPQSDKPTKPALHTPEGAHNKTLTSLQNHAPQGGQVLPDGKAPVGQPSKAQNNGGATQNPVNDQPPPAQAQPTQGPSGQGTPVANATSQPPAPASVPEPTVAPTATPVPRPPATPTPRPTATLEPTRTPRPTAIPEPTNTPRPPPPPTPRPEPTNTPRPRGKSRSASYNPPVPVIPSELADEKLASSVTARVTISTDGSVSADLLSSSGNAQADGIILRALERRRGKPKLRDGEPVESTVTVRVEIPR